MVFLGLEVGSWADWLAAVGTILAVIIALKGRTDKAKIKINAEFSYEKNWSGVPKKFGTGPLMVSTSSEKDPKKLEYSGYCLIIYISNIRQSSGLITSWGIITPNGKKELSTDAILIRGFDVEKIIRNTSIYTDPSDTIDQILKYKNISKKIKLYFQEVNGQTHYCNIIDKQFSNGKVN